MKSKISLLLQFFFWLAFVNWKEEKLLFEIWKKIFTADEYLAKRKVKETIWTKNLSESKFSGPKNYNYFKPDL